MQVLGDSSSVPCGCCTTAVQFVPAIEKELLFCPSWQCYQSLSTCFLLASSASFCVLIYIFCMTSPMLCIISASACGHLHMLPPVCALWMCVLVYFTDVLMTLTFMFMPVISLSVFAWLFWDSLSVMHGSGPGLYIMHTLYCCILSKMHCNCWDNMATCLPSIAK